MRRKGCAVKIQILQKTETTAIAERDYSGRFAVIRLFSCFRQKSQAERQQFDGESEIDEHGAHVYKRGDHGSCHDSRVKMQLFGEDRQHRADAFDDDNGKKHGKRNHKRDKNPVGISCQKHHADKVDGGKQNADHNRNA